ncbi:MAG: hypothetical protein ACW981_08910 [Candidatus Hodarchaeales archaeon]
MITSPINDYQFDILFNDNDIIDELKGSILEVVKKIINVTDHSLFSVLI